MTARDVLLLKEGLVDKLEMEYSHLREIGHGSFFFVCFKAFLPVSVEKNIIWFPCLRVKRVDFL